MQEGAHVTEAITWDRRSLAHPGHRRSGRARRLRPVLEADHAVGHRRLGFPVRDVDDRHGELRRQAPEDLHEVMASFGIDHRRGLVGDEQCRTVGQRAGHRQPLELTSRQRRRVAPLHAPQPDRGEQGGHIRALGLGQSPRDVVVDADAENLGFGSLGHERDAARSTQAGRSRPVDVATGGRNAGQQPSQRRLARPVRADDGDELAASDREVYAAERVVIGTRVAVGHTGEADRERRDVVGVLRASERGEGQAVDGRHPCEPRQDRAETDPRRRHHRRDRSGGEEAHGQPPVGQHHVDGMAPPGSERAE